MRIQVFLCLVDLRNAHLFELECTANEAFRVEMSIWSIGPIPTTAIGAQIARQGDGQRAYIGSPQRPQWVLSRLLPPYRGAPFNWPIKLPQLPAVPQPQLHSLSPNDEPRRPVSSNIRVTYFTHEYSTIIYVRQSIILQSIILHIYACQSVASRDIIYTY
jgi:hypothetical protein